MSDRTGGRIDQVALQEQLEAKLKERDTYWEQKIEELKLSLASVQGENFLIVTKSFYTCRVFKSHYVFFALSNIWYVCLLL